MTLAAKMQVGLFRSWNRGEWSSARTQPVNTLTCGHVPVVVCKSVAGSCAFAVGGTRVLVAKALANSCTFA